MRLSLFLHWLKLELLFNREQWVFPFYTSITACWITAVRPHFIRSNSEKHNSLMTMVQLQLWGSKSYLGTQLPQTLWKWIFWWMTSKVKPKPISSRFATPLLIALCSWYITHWTCSCALQSNMWANNSSVTLVRQFLNMPIHSLTAAAKHSHHMMWW